MKKYLYFVTTIFLLLGCDNEKIDNTKHKENYYPNTKKNITINGSETKKIIKTANSSIELNITTPRDIYIVTTSHFNNQPIYIKSSIINSNKIFKYQKEDLREFNKTIPKKVLEFRANVHNLLHKSKSKNFHSYKNIVDDVKEGKSKFKFCTDMDISYLCTEYTDATVRKVIKDIPTKYGLKNLIIWVEDDEYDDGRVLSKGTITQEMVNDLAKQFLQNSDNSQYDDDIYDWDTNIFGKEWGSDAQEIDQNLIANSGTIEILIYNMNTNGLAGYFWPKDNFIKSYILASNEKIMFYINSKLYAKDKKETFTTLAHEFQHMIHFYQRDVLLNIEDPIWFNEMLSEAAEDILAIKLKHKGPRNVDYTDGSAGATNNKKGRYPLFNQYNYLSLTCWDNNLRDYSLVSSFGAFLIRNYNGAKVLHDMMFSEYKGKEAVVDATKERDFNVLLNKWAEAVILSDIEDLDDLRPRYNFGDFIESSYGNITYKIGSINFFNYSPTPTFKSKEVLNKDANLYYKLGENLSGVIDINISMPKGGDVIIIAK